MTVLNLGIVHQMTTSGFFKGKDLLEAISAPNKAIRELRDVFFDIDAWWEESASRSDHPNSEYVSDNGVFLSQVIQVRLELFANFLFDKKERQDYFVLRVVQHLKKAEKRN